MSITISLDEYNALCDKSIKYDETVTLYEEQLKQLIANYADMVKKYTDMLETLTVGEHEQPT